MPGGEGPGAAGAEEKLYPRPAPARARKEAQRAVPGEGAGGRLVRLLPALRGLNTGICRFQWRGGVKASRGGGIWAETRGLMEAVAQRRGDRAFQVRGNRECRGPEDREGHGEDEGTACERSDTFRD